MSTATLKNRITEWREENPLRVERKAQDLSMAECALTLGVGQSSIQMWENGAQQPSPDNVAAIAAFVGVSERTLTSRWARWYKTRPTT